MYTLLSGLYDLYNRKEDYYVIILGLDNAGKTTLLERIKSTYSAKEIPIHADKIAPTVGLNIGTIDLNATCINFWDLGGQQELRRLWKKYYSESHAVLFVCDASDLDRIEEARATFETIIATEELEGVPMLLLANKSDKPGAISVAHLKEIFNPVAAKLGARDSKVLSVSALEGTGVREAMDWLFLRLERNRPNRPPILRPL
ncbi:ADP-ribosylation factor family-domain-containing protein [Chytriomyces sp. MP71]|nr:ADP-ribosylation factor family-domain-containing protein [Chytriomyces sp. MP71]